MIFVVLASLAVVLTCIGASFRRLYFATTPTALAPAPLVKALTGPKGRAAYADVCAAIVATPDADWERDVVEALAQPPGLRAALINEQLSELDWRLQRWIRVPRVCASISSSAGFLLAAMALRIGLAGIENLADVDVGERLNAAALDALGIAALGMWGTVTCISIQMQARRVVKSRLEATDKWIERLEALQPGHS
ncbi:hypothetical protein LZC95_17935 [Pendulispora brunnea]|uniref:MotA/TolQ/ExbB proton channel domain-containing protein n=1 Tax=Pendulispora brunnea TaxID=2905690 RepID=A0ABZ2KJ60_9BACT